MVEDKIEQTLFVAKEVNVYKIPPRQGAGGHRSGDWMVADKIFTGRLRVVSIGELCELRLEDRSSADLFAMCPVPLGQRAVAVEPVSDSSRYFVLRLVDATTKRHAFIGMGFNDRSEAFDFNVALSDHEKYVKRTEEVEAAAAKPDQAASTEAAALYKKQDLSLKEGETIKINMARRTTGDKAASSGTTGGGFLSGLAPLPSGGSQTSQQQQLAPPASSLRPPPAVSQPGPTPWMGGAGSGGPQSSRPQQQQEPAADILGLGGDSSSVSAVTTQLADSKPFGAQTATTATKQTDWATFE